MGSSKAVKALLPLFSVPKNGRTFMLVCEGGAHVEVKWISVRVEGELVWEGFCYTDALLADLCPDGPRAPAYWYEKPVDLWSEPVVKTKLVKVKEARTWPTQSEWSDWFHSGAGKSNFSRFPGTPAQAVTIFERLEGRACHGPLILVGFGQDHHYSEALPIIEYDEGLDTCEDVVERVDVPMLEHAGQRFTVDLNGYTNQCGESLRNNTYYQSGPRPDLYRGY